MSEKHRNDIVEDSFYLVSLFKKDSNEVTQLQIQKLMYFFEAYYMVKNDKDSLYDCPFKAWALGPVAIPLYKKYQNYGSSPISLTNDEEKLGNSTEASKKKLLEEIYDFFGKKYNSIQLVNLTHMDGSPWQKIWDKNGKKVVYGSEGDISKVETKDWFAKVFMKDE